MCRRSRGPDCPSFASFTPQGRRESRMPIAHPRPRAQKQKAHEQSHHRFNRINSAFPARMVLTVSFALSLVNRALLPPSFAARYRKFDISVGMSGPRDFAVREEQRSSALPSRPSHPAPNVRDDREAPLQRSAGRRELVQVICPTAQAEFSRQRRRRQNDNGAADGVR
jgi:hypothetical protein